MKYVIKYEFVFAILLMVLFFLAERDAVSLFAYSIIAIPIVVYYFPVKWILDKLEDLDTRSERILRRTSDTYIAFIISISIAVLLVENPIEYKTYRSITNILNTAIMIYFGFKHNKGKFASHLLLGTLCLPI